MQVTSAREYDSRNKSNSNNNRLRAYMVPLTTDGSNYFHPSLQFSMKHQLKGTSTTITDLTTFDFYWTCIRLDALSKNKEVNSMSITSPVTWVSQPVCIFSIYCSMYRRMVTMASILVKCSQQAPSVYNWVGSKLMKTMRISKLYFITQVIFAKL